MAAKTQHPVPGEEHSRGGALSWCGNHILVNTALDVGGGGNGREWPFVHIQDGPAHLIEKETSPV